MNLELIKNLSDETLKKYLGESYAALAAKLSGKVNSSKMMALDYNALTELSAALESESRARANNPAKVTRTDAVMNKIEEAKKEITRSDAVNFLASGEVKEVKEEVTEHQESTDLINGRHRKYNSRGQLNKKPMRYVYSIIRDGREKEITPQDAKKVAKAVIGNPEWTRRNFDIYGYVPMKNQIKLKGVAHEKLRLNGQSFILKAVVKE